MKPPEPNLPEAEILIGRLIDGEAAPADRARFDHLAEQDASLWRLLAERQLDAALLAGEVALRTSHADAIELPEGVAEDVDAAAPAAGWSPRRLMTWAGWAAAIALAATWWAIESRPKTLKPGDLRPAAENAASRMTAEEHFRAYLDSGFVVGGDELEPLLLQIEEKPDGSKVVYYLRRVEEMVRLPKDAEIPIADGKLTKKPAELHEQGSQPPADRRQP